MTKEEKFIKKAKKIHGDRYDYSKTIYTKMDEEIDVICKDHGIFTQIANNHMSGATDCPYCISKESKGIKKIKEWLNKNKILFIQENDIIKNEYCNNNNIKLIRIKYTEFNNIEKILTKELL